jgi:hypothetical protein
MVARVWPLPALCFSTTARYTPCMWRRSRPLITCRLRIVLAWIILLGALLARYYFEKRFGLKWRQYAPVLLAGFSCGMGLISMFSLGCLLISKAVFQLPY